MTMKNYQWKMKSILNPTRKSRRKVRIYMFSSRSDGFVLSNHILVHSSFPLLNGVYCRSIGIQCNPSTVNQSTSTVSCNLSDDEENLSDRRIRILTPSSDILKTLNSIKRSNSEEFNLSKDPPMVLTSTCLDDDQMVKEFFIVFSKQFSFRHM